MAFTEFYCNASTGSNLNAGSTDAGAASLTYASGSWVQSTGVFTVASGDPVADGVAVGDFASVYADGSTVTGFVGRVTARDATTITVSLTAKSGTAPTDGSNNRTLKIGGTWKGPNAAEGFPFGFVQSTLTNSSGDFPRVNLKNNATYSITAQISDSNNGPISFQGYGSTVGDGGLALIDGGTSGTSYILLAVTGDNKSFLDLEFSNNGATGSASGVSFNGTEHFCRRLIAHHIRGYGITAASSFLVECEAYSFNQSNTSGVGGFRAVTGGGSVFKRCIAHDGSGSNNSGFAIQQTATLIDCIADSNGQHGFNITISGTVFLSGCEAYNNGSDGVNFGNTAPSVYLLENCNLVKNGGYGINGSGAGARNGAIVNCGFGAGTQANTSGQTNGLSAIQVIGSVTYPSDVTPWVDPANGDFRINLAQAKGAGRGTFPQTAPSYAGTVGYPDIGAAQHQDAGGSSGGPPSIMIVRPTAVHF